MWRRVRLIPFLQSFKGSQNDPDLIDKLKAEASGILNWAIAGCLAWQREGLEPPAAVANATQEYKEQSDRLAQFIEDCCLVEVGKSVPSAELWREYGEWAKQNDPEPLSRTELADHLKRRGFISEEVGHAKQRVWCGLALRMRPDAGVRAGAGVDFPNYSNNSSIEGNSANGHPQAPADPQLDTCEDGWWNPVPPIHDTAR